MATRREFFASCSAALMTVAIPRVARAAGEASVPRLIAAARVAARDIGAVWCADALTPFALPARGHSPARFGAHVILTGRRPGTYAAIVDPLDAKRPARIMAPDKGLALCGHAAVSPDGRMIVTSEIDTDSIKGFAVVRDANSAVRQRWDTGGIEPHDLLFADGGSRLVMAIGGLVHDGGVRGPIVNAAGIDSSIIELDAASGRVHKRHKLAPEFASLSLRHMALAPDGMTVVFGMQEQDLSGVRPVLGRLRVGKSIDLFPLPADEPNLFQGYIGSVAVDASGGFAAATSPRGGALGLWSLSSGTWLGGIRIADVCGLAADKQAGVFWASSGAGDIVKVRTGENGPSIAGRWHADAQFDNHLLLI